MSLNELTTPSTDRQPDLKIKTENSLDLNSEDENKLNESKIDQATKNEEMEISQDQQTDDKTFKLARIQLNESTLDNLTKDDLIKKWKLQNDYIDSLEQKLKLELSNKEMYQDNEDKIKQQLFDLTRKENLLVMKLTTKEHEIQDYIVSMILDH